LGPSKIGQGLHFYPWDPPSKAHQNPESSLKIVTVQKKTFVSMRNKIWGHLFFTIKQSSRTVSGFSSPQQFQLIIFMMIGGAAEQPLPNHSPTQKPMDHTCQRLKSIDLHFEVVRNPPS
jgi:hypothetical protein